MKKIKKKKACAGDWLRICFECLRRNEKYQERFKKIKELWERADDIRLRIRFEKAQEISLDSSEAVPWNPTNFAQQMKQSNIEILINETIKAFEEFGLNYSSDGPFDIPQLPDPNKSFDELIYPDFKLKRLFLIFDKNAVTSTRFIDIDKERIYCECFRIDINFNEVNSIDALKDHINFVIDEHWKRYKKKRINWTEYDEYLKNGDKIAALKKENPLITWPELARIIFPEDWHDELARESAIKKTTLLYEHYTDMVENGWRKYRFP